MALSDVEKIRKLPWMVTADIFNTGFVYLTFAGSVFILFLDELGLDNAQIGFMLALIPFCGLVAPFIAPWVTRFGYKRTFVTFWGLRKVAISMLLFTPAVIARFGAGSAFYWAALVIGAFGLCRAIAETGSNPWMKEAIPNSIRGKFAAIDSMVMTVAGIGVTLAAGYVIDSQTGLGRFMLLLAVGVVIGLLGVAAYAQVPGESPAARLAAGTSRFQDHVTGMKTAVSDRRFVQFLIALGLASMGGTAVISFIPLFMKEQIGLSDGVVVLLSIGTYVGSLLTSYLWGWATDRYGSKPVMQSSLVLTLLLPIAWFLLPRHSNASAPLAMFIAFFVGVATLAWQISWARYLYVHAVPDEQKASYTAVYYAWYSSMNGIGPLFAGMLLNWGKAIDTHWLLFTLDAYTPLFFLSIIFLTLAIATVSRLPEENETTLRRFAGMFLRLDTARSLGLLIQHYFAGDEQARMTTTERMGETKNPLSTQELLEALADPSFNVRFEAIQAIGRMPAQPELVDALLDVLHKPASELSMVAARALGRLGDKRAIPPLRQSLVSGYWFLEANSARALAMLDDAESIPVLLQKLRDAPNERFKLAFVSALGKLRAAEAIDDLFALLHHSQFLAHLPSAEMPEDVEVLRGEIGLALARIVGDERYYLQQWRAMRAGMETAVVQAILSLEKPAKRLELPEVVNWAERATHYFARGNDARGTHALSQMLQALPCAALPDTTCRFQQACLLGLGEFGSTRKTFILLSLQTLDVGMKQLAGAARE
ncbi:MAG: MFS transporter [Ardenticatenaceae bacterium]|nr:MFS transporter [Ardenticatenaceae bacterium]